MSTPLPRATDELYDALVGFFLRPARPDRARLLGLEFECLRARSDDCSAAPSRGEEGPDPLVLALGDLYRAEFGAPDVVRETGEIAVLHLGALNFSLEPGGQIEISLPPFETPRIVEDQLRAFAPRMEALLAETRYRALYLGHQPRTLPCDIPLRAKPRYEIMDRRLAASGRLGAHMMRATAGMQVTLDYRDEAECVAMLQAALVTAPFVTAMFANSPLVGGKPSGYLSFREHAWWDTDPSRCGVPIGVLHCGSGLRGYVDFALDAEAWFVRRDGELREVQAGRSFRELLDAGEELTLDDFNLHSSTLFPSARLRGGVEVRSADCVPIELAPAFAALMAGVLYDEELRTRAAELHTLSTPESLRELHEAAARDGVTAHAGGVTVRDGCARLLELAREGLARHERAGVYEQGTTEMLAPVEEIVATGESPAVATLRRFESSGRIC